MVNLKKYIPSAAIGATRAGEHNDCMVRAVTNVTGKSYDEVHAIMKKFGRKDRCGTPWYVCAAVMNHLGFEGIAIGKNRTASYMKRVHGMQHEQKGVTLKRLTQDLPRGKFVVIVRGHATALVNGNIIDTFDNNGNRDVAVLWYHPDTVFEA